VSNFIKKLLNSNKTKKLIHPFFGPLSLCKNKQLNQYYWNGKITFEGQSITLRIDANKESPNENHIIFFTHTIKNLDWVIKKGTYFIANSFEVWTGKTYLENFLDEFKCVALDIPFKGKAKNNWQITFARRSNPDFIFTIYFVNNKVESTDLD
jgi:hypothetical protein